MVDGRLCACAHACAAWLVRVRQVYDVVQQVRSDFPSIRFGTGKKVFELRCVAGPLPRSTPAVWSLDPPTLARVQTC
jgi:hypothetical protein